jgi:hypothetical protein
MSVCERVYVYVRMCMSTLVRMSVYEYDSVYAHVHVSTCDTYLGLIKLYHDGLHLVCTAHGTLGTEHPCM